MSKFQPDGWRTITPRIVTSDVRGLAEFLRTVFDAAGEYRVGAPTELKIGDSIVMVSGESEREAMPAFLYVYVINADETYQRAIGLGARSIEEPRDTPYGDRRAMVQIHGVTSGRSRPIVEVMKKMDRRAIPLR